MIIGPENRTATANDNFLKVNLIGDFAGYTNIPAFEDFYLVIPREVSRTTYPFTGLFNFLHCKCKEPSFFTGEGGCRGTTRELRWKLFNVDVT